MEKIYETYVDNNEIKLKYIGEFNSYKEYINNTFINYNTEEQLNIKYVFTESELISLKEQMIFKIDNSYDDKEFFGLRTNRKFIHLGFSNNEESFLTRYYDEDDYGFSMASDGVFYGNVPILKNILEVIETTIKINNISNEDILSYFNDNQNIKENDL